MTVRKIVGLCFQFSLHFIFINLQMVVLIEQCSRIKISCRIKILAEINTYLLCRIILKPPPFFFSKFGLFFKVIPLVLYVILETIGCFFSEFSEKFISEKSS